MPEEWKPGYRRTIDIEDLPLRYVGIQNLIGERYGFGEDEMSGLENFAAKTALIESEGGTVNPRSSASGIYQFLSRVGGGQNSFQTGMNRLRTSYDLFESRSPDWVSEVEEDSEAGDLAPEHQKELFFGNLFSRIKSPKLTEKLFRGAAAGDLDSQVRLYMDYHHGPGGTKEQRRKARERAISIYGGRYYGGGLIRNPHGSRYI